ncbi:Bicupin, oxalate decarboxylase/oxidase [Mollisia scopiformis]|uniref:Bicupin, oxalate decarboxylase/oxidase n=1 Tax=Mollisia scopiformis TaxID=149040 RepID=A0A194XGZ6_MOLSC|nr:Bicupin, oxalate decarboxylase/oxidase [Mollisia scopiformis]KUJ19438.1 Bicupin, oxalate decarboxylase/oxidase [Mollisia scopiformis]
MPSQSCSRLLGTLLAVASLHHIALAAPTGSSTAPVATNLLGFSPSNTVKNEDTDNIQYALAAGQTDTGTIGAFLDFNNVENPQPIRGTKGGTDPGPRTEAYDLLNPDKLAPPGSDHGNVNNAQWPMGLSHMKLGLGRAGWSRQQNIDNIPTATEMAGVDMRLEEGAYRELHWHKAAEWSYVLNGSVRVEAVNEDGQTFVDDLNAGDVWFFPPGVPHSLQGLKGGVEFLLVFDDGSFSEDNTFLASELFATQPREVLSKNFGGLPLSAWANIPPGELFIFPGTDAPADISEQNIVGSAGLVPTQQSYTYHSSKATPNHVTAGGTVTIIDPLVFPIASEFSAAIVTVKPGAIREIHWHTSSDEWNFFIAGSARIGIYAAQGNARTFDYHAGDTGYIPKSMTHYVENVGQDDVIFIEVLQADHFSDISVGQWVGLLPPQIVIDTLNLTNETVSQFKKEKQYIVQGDVVA